MIFSWMKPKGCLTIVIWGIVMLGLAVAVGLRFQNMAKDKGNSN